MPKEELAALVNLSTTHVSVIERGLKVTKLDTFVAIVSGLIIFPACFSYGVNPGSGPNLLFVTLPTILQDIPLGRLFAIILYVAMIFAGVSSLLAKWNVNVLDISQTILQASINIICFLVSFLVLYIVLAIVLNLLTVLIVLVVAVGKRDKNAVYKAAEGR